MIANTALVLLALAAIAETSLPFALKLSMGCIALAYGAWQLHAHVQQRGVLLWQQGWQWIERNREPRALELQSAVIWPELMVLRLRDPVMNRMSESRHPIRLFRYLKKRNLTLTLCRDSLNADDSRRLRAYLRHWPVLAD